MRTCKKCKNPKTNKIQKRKIEPSASPWASPVVLMKKKDGGTRFCVDYQKLNELTKKDSYPSPWVDMTFDALSGSSWFSTLNLKSGYGQVEVEEQDREKTTKHLRSSRILSINRSKVAGALHRLKT